MKKLVTGILLLVFLMIGSYAVFVLAVESSASSHRLNFTINPGLYFEFGEGIKVSNACLKDVFIPSNTLAEWTSFNNSAPSCLILVNDFVDCPASPTGSTCTGSIIASASSGETWTACLNLAAGQADGTCLLLLFSQDDDCRLYDGVASGVGGTSGTCTDYD